MRIFSHALVWRRDLAGQEGDTSLLVLDEAETDRLLLDQAEQGVSVRVQQAGRLRVGATFQNLHAIEPNLPTIKLINVIPPGALRPRSRDVLHLAHKFTPQKRIAHSIDALAAWPRSTTGARSKLVGSALAVIINERITQVTNPHRSSISRAAFPR